MKLTSQAESILIQPENSDDAKQCIYLAKRTPWKFSQHARAWVVPKWAFNGLPDSFQRFPILGGGGGERRLRENRFVLSLLPKQCKPYPFQQEEILNLLTGPWGLWASCGVGKTICALAAYHILKKQGKVDGAIVIGPENGRHVWCGPDSDAAKWIDSPGHYLENSSDGSDPLPRSGIIYTTAAKVFLAPYHTWIQERLRTGRFVMIIDEVQLCFPYETLVTTDEGDIPIGDVVELGRGKKVLSYNKELDTVEWRSISDRFRNQVRNLVRVYHEFGSFDCTPNHKVWTLEEGYVNAGDLNSTHTLLSNISHSDLRTLRKPLCLEKKSSERCEEWLLFPTMHESSGKCTNPHMLNVQDTFPVGVRHQQYGATLLHPAMCCKGSRAQSSSKKSTYPSGLKKVVPPYENGQPYVPSRESQASFGEPQSEGTQTTYSRWEWETSELSTANSLQCFRRGLGDGAHSSNERQTLSDALQDRHSESTYENRYRSGRRQSSIPKSPGEGHQKNHILTKSRVVRVEILEQASPEGSVHGALYDIEVEGNHNYFADGVLVSNCVGPFSKRYAIIQSWARWCQYRWLLSATPTGNYPDTFWGVYCLLTLSNVTLDTWVQWFRIGERTGSASRWHTSRLKALGDYLSFCTSVINKDDVAPWLPSVTHRLIKVPMVGRQLALYKELLGLSKASSGLLAQMQQAGKNDWRHQLIYLTSMASHPIVAQDNSWKDSDIAKLPMLRELISGAGDQKICIWSWHPKVLNWLANLLGPSSVCYHGEVSKAGRETAVKRFNEDPDCQFFLGNPSAAGTSLNLGAGTVRIFWDMGWSWNQYHQACERINRITRTKPITSYVMLSEGSVEEIMWKSVCRKEELSSLIISKEQSPTTYEEVMAAWKS